MKTKIALSLLAMVGAGLGIAWATGQFESDPNYTEAKQLQQEIQETFQEIDSKTADARNEATHEERRELFEQLQEKAESLPEEQKFELRTSMQKFFMQRMQQHVDEFFELPPEERTAALDEHIDRMERFRGMRKEGSKGGSGKSGGKTASGDQPAASNATSSAAQNGGTKEGGAAASSGSDASGKKAGRRPGPPDRANMSKEERDRFRRNMLDETTPETRAKFTEFRRLVNERRKERGMEAFRRP